MQEMKTPKKSLLYYCLIALLIIMLLNILSEVVEVLETVTDGLDEVGDFLNLLG